ncbi:unnamed protein product [Orchesella dallaii]|uniref:Uncharacterized protein n=1 Tax=Orchesella dallaii TaxID=48710 RepID=A0ABP1QDP4_9HEXA
MYAISETLVERIRSQRESENLDLSLCEITNIPLRAIKDHYGTPKDLDLSYNLIGYIKPVFVLDMKHCTKLNLARNGLQKLPENFGDMDQLTYLDLHANQVLKLELYELIRLQECFLTLFDVAYHETVLYTYSL